MLPPNLALLEDLILLEITAILPLKVGRVTNNPSQVELLNLLNYNHFHNLLRISRKFK